MGKKTRKRREIPTDSTSISPPLEALSKEALDLVEAATKDFRLRLLDAVEEHLRKMPADRDLKVAVARFAVEAILGMVSVEGEWPLTPYTLATVLQASAWGDEIRIETVAPSTSAKVGDQAWDAQNKRRLSLIYQSMDRNLTGEEARELQELQAKADGRLEQLDIRLLDGLRRMKQAVEQLPSDS